MTREGDNMKKQATITIAVLFTVVTMIGTSFAGNGAFRRGHHQMGSDGYALSCYQDWAKLTDDQKNRLKALHQQFIDETASARASIISRHEEIRILMETTSPDPAKLHALSSELSEFKKQVMDKNIDMALSAKKIAPELDISMMIGGHGSMGRGMGMMGKCNMMDEMGRGMGRTNCPLMVPPPDQPDQDDATPKEGKKTQSDNNKSK